MQNFCATTPTLSMQYFLRFTRKIRQIIIIIQIQPRTLKSKVPNHIKEKKKHFSIKISPPAFPHDASIFNTGINFLITKWTYICHNKVLLQESLVIEKKLRKKENLIHFPTISTLTQFFPTFYKNKNLPHNAQNPNYT